MNGLYIVLRLIALILLVVALLLLGGDFVTSLERGRITVRSAAEVWSIFDKHGVAGFQAWTQGALPKPVAGWSMALLNLWSWGLFGVPGIVLAFLFGQRAKHSE